MLLQKFKEWFPEKTRKISVDDQPWISHKLKIMDRIRKREYHKHRKSDKWQRLNRDFKQNVKCAKQDFYKKNNVGCHEKKQSYVWDVLTKTE